MKKIFSYILFFMVGISVFGLSGNLAGEKDLKIIKTKWLDIIYPESCEQSAFILQENGDEIFVEVTGQYGLEPDFRIPVVITPSVDLYNAFYTPAPYNRIVLFDTSTQTLDDLSSSFNHNLLSTFRHELTHAVTYNMKNGFWNGITNIFGDVMVPGNVFVTSGMAEGAAVASESAGGEGRLNDEFAKYIVKQAKIEGKFPSYYDVQGSGDNMFPGIYYYFNGAFHQWLQEKYGMEKYADFWHKVLNVNRPGVNWCFKKVYGTSIRKAWKEFEEDYKIPGNLKDNSECELNIKANGGERYKAFSKSEKGLYFVEESGQSLFFLKNGEQRPKKIFTFKGIDNVGVSEDGRVAAVSYFSNDRPTVTAKIDLYDFNTNESFSVKEDGIKNGRLMQWQGDYYLVCHKFNSPNNSLLIYKIIFSDKNEITAVENIVSKNMELNTFVCEFTDLGNGNFAYLKKSGKNFAIEVSDLSGNIKAEYKLPQGISLRYLSENNGILYFSWTKKDTMARAGYFNPSNNELFLSKEDFSGGIYYPLVFNFGDSQRVAYIGNFYDESKIFETDINSIIFTNGEKVIISEEKNENEDLVLDNKGDAKGALLAEDYKWYKNLYGGLLIPFSIYNNSLLNPFGVTYATSNPWSNGVDDLLIFTAGWGYLTNSVGIEAIINKGSATSVFSYSADVKTEFDRKGWKLSSGNFTFGSGFNFGKTSSLYFENYFSIAGGRQNNGKCNLGALDMFKFWEPEVVGALEPVEDNVVFNLYNFVSTIYSNIAKRGPGRFQYGGVEANTGIGFVLDSEIGRGFAITSSFGAMIPGVIPVKQKKGLVYNLPLKFNCTLLPLASAYGKTGATLKEAGYGVLDTNIEAVLFGLDIQKAIPYFDFVFLQDFYITAGYCSTIASYKGSQKGFQLPCIFDYFGNLGNGKSIYLDSFYLRAQLDFIANIGVFASDLYTNSVFVKLNVPINVVPGMKKSVVFDFGFQLGF